MALNLKQVVDMLIIMDEIVVSKRKELDIGICWIGTKGRMTKCLTTARTNSTTR